MQHQSAASTEALTELRAAFSPHTPLSCCLQTAYLCTLMLQVNLPSEPKDDIFKQSLFGIKLGVCFNCDYFICHHRAFSCQKNILALLKLDIFLAACTMCACAVWLFVASASSKRGSAGVSPGLW